MSTSYLISKNKIEHLEIFFFNMEKTKKSKEKQKQDRQ